MDAPALQFPTLSADGAARSSAAMRFGSAMRSADALRSASDTRRGDSTADAPADARRAAMKQQMEQLLSSTFFGQVFKLMRSSPLRTNLSGGSSGEQAFGALMDSELGQRMARKAAGRLADVLVRRMEAVIRKNANQVNDGKVDLRA